MVSRLELEIREGFPGDYGCRTVRMPPRLLYEEGIEPEDTVLVKTREKTTVARTWRTPPEDFPGEALLDPYLLENTGFEKGDTATTQKRVVEPLFLSLTGGFDEASLGCRPVRFGEDDAVLQLDE